jgi:putative lipoic acid-binding regulatory protein
MLSEEARRKLRERLDQVHEWPSVYMYKFICEPDAARIDRIVALFPPEVEVLRRYSTGGKYVSLTVREVMMSSEDVVERYAKAAEIEGVIVL